MKKPIAPERQVEFKTIGRIPTGDFFKFLEKMHDLEQVIIENGYTDPFMTGFAGSPEVQVQVPESDVDFAEKMQKYQEDLDFYNTKEKTNRKKLYAELKAEFDPED